MNRLIALCVVLLTSSLIAATPPKEKPMSFVKNDMIFLKIPVQSYLESNVNTYLCKDVKSNTDDCDYFENVNWSVVSASSKNGSIWEKRSKARNIEIDTGYINVLIASDTFISYNNTNFRWGYTDCSIKCSGTIDSLKKISLFTKQNGAEFFVGNLLEISGEAYAGSVGASSNLLEFEKLKKIDLYTSTLEAGTTYRSEPNVVKYAKSEFKCDDKSLQLKVVDGLLTCE